MNNFNDLHYFPLPYQGNFYSLGNIEMGNNSNKLLVATSKREIYYLEYQECGTNMSPSVKEVSFTYIPSGAEIISFDVFNKSLLKNEIVIGVTIIKNNSNLDSLEFYLNIYSEWEESEDFNIENVGQNCLTLELSFIPYQLTHTYLIIWEHDNIQSKEFVFVLSGSDNQIHIYREHTFDHLYKEMDQKDYFPEFLTKTPSPVVYMDIYLDEDCTERITAIGCECGFLRVTKVCMKTLKILYNFSAKLDNFISCVRLYRQTDKPVLSSNLLKYIQPNNYNECTLNLLVINTILPAILFEDIDTYGLSKTHTLPRRDLTSVQSCCHVADFDFDGEKEIIIGNSAQELMFYKHHPSEGWFLEDIKLFASPLLSLEYADMMGNGIKELIVLSTKGVTFLQHDFVATETALHRKLECLAVLEDNKLETSEEQEGNS